MMFTKFWSPNLDIATETADESLGTRPAIPQSMPLRSPGNTRVLQITANYYSGGFSGPHILAAKMWEIKTEKHLDYCHVPPSSNQPDYKKLGLISPRRWEIV